MRKFIALAAGAALFGGMLAGAAEARPGYRGYGGGMYRGHPGPYAYRGRPGPYVYGYRHRRGNAGAAVAAGLAGALIGGAIASQQPRYYGYGGYPAYGPPAYYGY